MSFTYGSVLETRKNVYTISACANRHPISFSTYIDVDRGIWRILPESREWLASCGMQDEEKQRFLNKIENAYKKYILKDVLKGHKNAVL